MEKGPVTLRQLMWNHGAALGVRTTTSDRQLPRNRLAALADAGRIQFAREGRELVARSTSRKGPTAAPEETLRLAARVLRAEPAVAAVSGRPDLEVIKAYAGQLEASARILVEQIARLVRMIREV